METVEMRIYDLEEDGRRPSGKMIKEKEVSKLVQDSKKTQ